MTSECTNRELLIYTIARLLAGVRHVAVGMSSPMPAAGAMLLRVLNKKNGREDVQLSILGSIAHNALPLDASPIALYRRIAKAEVVTGVRIGITKAAELPWRYGLKGSKFLSKPFTRAGS